jgi:predicted ATPase
MIHLHSMRLSPIAEEQARTYPFSVPVIQSLIGGELVFSSPVTFLIGENGSGKSTLLEALACASRAHTVGSESVEGDRTLASVGLLARSLKLSWRAKKHLGFFMRSEDFFGFVKWTRNLREEYKRDLEEIDNEYAQRSEMARNFARLPFLNQLADMEQRYGADLDANSHGESYFKLFQSRFVPNGLYLMDEPEAPLSPMRQIGLLSMIKMMVEEQNAQFIIATHSPILMAYPGATIYGCDGGYIRSLRYDDVEHVSLTRDFLNNPQRFLRHI